MPPPWSSAKLSCFYCGQTADLHFSNQESFHCADCDATNWLDKDGCIADPPTLDPDAASRPTRYASRIVDPLDGRGPSRPGRASSKRDSIFCTKCLANQRMMTETMKQYEFADDPTDPEYAVRERKYRKFKEGLEKSYPQMCASCEPKVRQQLQNASYTAKTDHMRRMMDRTKSHYRDTRQRGKLDMVDWAGYSSWSLAFRLQFLWHFQCLLPLLDFRMSSERQSDAMKFLLTSCRYALRLLPAPHKVMLSAITAGVLSSPWNPKFRQLYRGFTVHILGLRQWYTYQLILLLIRYVCWCMSMPNDSDGISDDSLTCAHLFIGFLTHYIYNVAAKSISTDTSRLFGTTARPPARQGSAALKQPKDVHGLGTIVDDMQSGQPNSRADAPTLAPRPTRSSDLRERQPELGMQALRLSEIPAVKPKPLIEYDADMDWTPSGSQHRAFSTHNPFKVKNPYPRFGDVPIEPKSGPIWTRVPAAPSNPARDRYNLPPRPGFQERGKENEAPVRRATADASAPSHPSASVLDFQESRFRAPGPDGDPREDLTDMMRTFAITPGRDLDGSNSEANVEDGPSDTRARWVELVALLLALWAWFAALGMQNSDGRRLAMAALGASLIISLRLAVDSVAEARLRGDGPPSASSWVNLGTMQVALVLAVAWSVVIETDSTFGQASALGPALFGIMIVHQLWHVLL